jgi:hypothetical protein
MYGQKRKMEHLFPVVVHVPDNWTKHSAMNRGLPSTIADTEFFVLLLQFCYSEIVYLLTGC